MSRISEKNRKYASGAPAFELSFEERFNQLVAMVGGVDVSAELCAVARSTVYLWAKSEGKVPLGAALKLAQAAGLSLDWIATGYDRRPDLPTAPREDDDLVKVPRLGVTAAAGARAGIRYENADVEDHIYMPRALLEALGIPLKFLHFIRFHSDSMQPTIADGAIVLIDVSVNRYRGAGIYALSQEGDVSIKRLDKTVEGGFTAISDNPVYPQKPLTPAELYGLQIGGRVRWTERRL